MGFVVKESVLWYSEIQYRQETTTFPFEGSNRICFEDCQIKWVTPHILRHTFASQRAIAGVSLYKISKWLGHSNYSTTQIYAHLQAGDEEIDKI